MGGRWSPRARSGAQRPRASGEPRVPGKGVGGAPVRGPGRAGARAGRRRAHLRLGWACEGAAARPGRPRGDPGAVPRRVALAAGRSPSPKTWAAPAPGKPGDERRELAAAEALLSPTRRPRSADVARRHLPRRGPRGRPSRPAPRRRARRPPELGPGRALEPPFGRSPRSGAGVLVLRPDAHAAKRGRRAVGVAGPSRRGAPQSSHALLALSADHETLGRGPRALPVTPRGGRL